MAVENSDLNIYQNLTKALLDNPFGVLHLQVCKLLSASHNRPKRSKKIHARDQYKTTQAATQQILGFTTCPQNIKFMVISLLQRDF